MPPILEPEKTSPGQRIVRITLTLLLLYLIFGVLIPSFASYEDVWDALTSLDPVALLFLTALTFVVEGCKAGAFAVHHRAPPLPGRLPRAGVGGRDLEHRAGTVRHGGALRDLPQVRHQHGGLRHVVRRQQLGQQRAAARPARRSGSPSSRRSRTCRDRSGRSPWSASASRSRCWSSPSSSCAASSSPGASGRGGSVPQLAPGDGPQAPGRGARGDRRPRGAATSSASSGSARWAWSASSCSARSPPT